MLASMALTPRGTSTWRSLEAYAIQSPLDLALDALGSLAWLAGRLFTTAHWLPLPLYDQAPWELWCGLLISLGLALLRSTDQPFCGGQLPGPCSACFPLSS